MSVSTIDPHEKMRGRDVGRVALKTAPADIRFPSTNQTRHCFARYGDEAPECEKFARYYRSLCPSEWIDKWNEQRELGTFAGPL
uniref:Cytochrome c oxidase subunit 6b-3-like n=1 Tax=Nelumbo nucifera TaxID=4432 RepID=A0A822XD48_NELNU|nr:TPA_asm: hypothetical protein HUJ06_019703 [Nelumbo nucifera]